MLKPITAIANVSQEDKKNLLALVAMGLSSAPVMALSTVLALGVSWNLEHLSIYKTKQGDETLWHLRRLSTQDTSNLRDPTRTPLMPPIQSTAIRLADAGSDTAEAALALVEKQMVTVKEEGLLVGIWKFIFGG